MTNTRYEVQEHEAGGWLVLDTDTGRMAELPTKADADRVAAWCNKLDADGAIRRTEYMRGSSIQPGLTSGEYYDTLNEYHAELESERLYW